MINVNVSKNHSTFYFSILIFKHCNNYGANFLWYSLPEVFMELKDDGTATFSINLIGNMSNETYMGNFKVKCLLSPLEEISADRMYRELLGVNSHLASEFVRKQAYALSQLEQRVMESPPFWHNEFLGGGHITDNNVIMEVLEKAVESQEKFKERKVKELKERQKALTKRIKSKKIQRDIEEEEKPVLEEAEEIPEI